MRNGRCTVCHIKCAVIGGRGMNTAPVRYKRHRHPRETITRAALLGPIRALGNVPCPARLVGRNASTSALATSPVEGQISRLKMLKRTAQRAFRYSTDDKLTVPADPLAKRMIMSVPAALRRRRALAPRSGLGHPACPRSACRS